MKFDPLKILGLTIAGLGLTSTAGSQGFLEAYIGHFSYVGAASIELSFICLAAIAAGVAIRDELAATARWVVGASMIFNFLHAYHQKVGVDLGDGVTNWTAVCYASVIAFFIPFIALRLSSIKAKLEAEKLETEKAEVETLAVPVVVPVVAPAPVEEKVSRKAPAKRAAGRKAAPRKKVIKPTVIFDSGAN